MSYLYSILFKWGVCLSTVVPSRRTVVLRRVRCLPATAYESDHGANGILRKRYRSILSSGVSVYCTVCTEGKSSFAWKGGGYKPWYCMHRRKELVRMEGGGYKPWCCMHRRKELFPMEGGIHKPWYYCVCTEAERLPRKKKKHVSFL